jgi:hypothetical protein
MTETGLAHVRLRLLSCPDLAALRRVWEGLGVEYQRHPDVMKLKEDLKQVLK